MIQIDNNFYQGYAKKALFPCLRSGSKIRLYCTATSGREIPESGSAPGPRGGTSPPRPATGAFAPWTLLPLPATSSLLL